MSGPNAGQSRKGGLTTWRDFAARPICLVLLFLFYYPSVALFPGLPLQYPLLGAGVGLVGFTYGFRRLHGSVGWRRLIKFIAAIVVTACAAALTIATMLAAAGWTEPKWLEIVAGFGAAFMTVLLATEWIFGVMFQRANDDASTRETGT